MQKSLHISTHCKEGAIDITAEIIKLVKESGVQTGIISIYAQGTTTALSIQENWDSTVQDKNMMLLAQLTAFDRIPFEEGTPEDIAQRNQIAHLKAALLGSFYNHSCYEWQNRFIALAKYFFI